MMKAGTYYVGDLCYVMHEVWDEFCDLTCPADGGVIDGQFQLKDGRDFAFSGTKYGDGTYYDQYGNRYYVDAGLIGCILFEDIDLTFAGNMTDGGQIVHFDQDFEVTYEDGDICFGSRVVIDTDPRYEEEEEEDYEYEDEE
jgi:hypothetical protein